MRRLLTVLTGAIAVVLPTLVLTAPALATSALPADPAANGYVGLCDETGHNVTGGNIDTRPFIWKAVASTHPPAEYEGAGENAVLNVYQPRPDVPAAEWSGLSITAASFYADHAHPAVQATYRDESMADFLQEFPPLVDGLVVLRMYYGKAGFGLYDQTYPATTIQVVGKRWSVVSGGTVDCGAAKAVSNEQLTGVVTKQQFTPHATAPAAQTTTGRSGVVTPAAITRAPVVGVRSSDELAPVPAADRGPGPSASPGRIWFVVVPVAVVLALSVLMWRRRTRSRPTAP